MLKPATLPVAPALKPLPSFTDVIRHRHRPRPLDITARDGVVDNVDDAAARAIAVAERTPLVSLRAAVCCSLMSFGWSGQYRNILTTKPFAIPLLGYQTCLV